ncbi:helix-turn-helix domain-containing protein [Fructilactobacillus fructivorans]|uniref:Helix-turn-helix domain-containing protein n=1 Tax=Fructilactobacillus fructivorans TaxID=1614 RepID=A0A0C1M7R8_9LACO|nr:helix-turn-helix transcriptional regulator [Fructilactobacillus fructivorans]KID42524.1 Helix-turn-helix motif [Fructilactobacillus fructivorans]KRK56933.1 Cro CI family phage transcriptional regulator [Fructilactobacillus fructivorans]KRN13213.1 Cro CI family phage transcriptional regulator [Fructilactobacillus fructivorans]KRN41202.1 Cro CI family phage transcriptional regulator [Fructilactobacillus fructivorans]KRN43017.1 Cro CI family phage transcriptional regulator [Fructilactobacillus
MSIYQRVKELAKNKNISIRELEHQLGFSNGTLQKWDKTANSQKLKKVANYFNVSVDYLLGNSTGNSADLDDLSTIMMFGGKPIPEEDRETVVEILRKLRNARNHQ